MPDTGKIENEEIIETGYEEGEVNHNLESTLTNINKTFEDMASGAETFYKDQIAAADAYGKEMMEKQQEQSEYTIQKIEQDKEEAEKDYIKEQSAAYVDWQKQSSAHGVNAEKMASIGMTKTGYSESSQVAMWNAYQKRIVSAREVFYKAKQVYDNSITEARLKNDSSIAEMAFNTLKTKLQLALEGFQYKNSLLTEKMDRDLNYALEKAKYPEINLSTSEENIYKDINGNPTSAPSKVNYKAITDTYGTMSPTAVAVLEEIGAVEMYVDENGVGQFNITNGFKKVEGKEGGANWGGINKDAWIETPDGLQYESSKYQEILQEAGMSKLEAKNFIIKLQKALGIYN